MVLKEARRHCRQPDLCLCNVAASPNDFATFSWLIWDSRCRVSSKCCSSLIDQSLGRTLLFGNRRVGEVQIWWTPRLCGQWNRQHRSIRLMMSSSDHTNLGAQRAESFVALHQGDALNQLLFADELPDTEASQVVKRVVRAKWALWQNLKDLKILLKILKAHHPHYFHQFFCCAISGFFCIPSKELARLLSRVKRLPRQRMKRSEMLRRNGQNLDESLNESRITQRWISWTLLNYEVIRSRFLWFPMIPGLRIFSIGHCPSCCRRRPPSWRGKFAVL